MLRRPFVVLYYIKKDGDQLADKNTQIILGLDVPKTVAQINADIKKLQKQLKKWKQQVHWMPVLW